MFLQLVLEGNFLELGLSISCSLLNSFQSLDVFCKVLMDNSISILHMDVMMNLNVAPHSLLTFMEYDSYV